MFFSTGPMVYGTCYSPISKKEELKDLNFAGNIFDRTGPKVIKLFSCSIQLRLKFILLINVKMPTFVGILTFMSRINY